MDDNFNQYVKSIEHFSKLSRREILIRLGDSVITQDSIGISAPTIKQCQDAAKKYFSENYTGIKSIICKNKGLIQSKETHVAAAIMDILMKFYGGLPIIFASLYVADYTVDKFCESVKEDFIISLDHDISEG